MLYDENDEVQIEISDTLSDSYIDATAAITIVEENAYLPTLRIDVETANLKFCLKKYERRTLLGF